MMCDCRDNRCDSPHFKVVLLVHTECMLHFELLVLTFLMMICYIVYTMLMLSVQA